ncbi:MAG: S9 family peptidase [Candidatus Lernaella stagnicola]|nr:S9 family peptidase [Candidatus Lernaella stagnicola]
MRIRLLLPAMLFFWLLPAVFAAPEPTPPPGPPYPIEAYLDIKQAYDADFTADGQTVVYRTNVSGTSQAWKISVTGGAPVQLTDYEDAVDYVVASPTDSNLLLFAKAAGGNERRQLFLMDADGQNVRRLTHNDEAIHNLGTWSRDGKLIAYASNDRNSAYFDVYVLELATGTSRLVCEMEAYLVPAAFSPSGRRLVVSKWDSNYDNNLYLVDLEEPGEPALLTPHTGWATYSAVRWPVGRESAEGFFLFSNLGGEFTKLGFLNVKKRTLVYQDKGPWNNGHLTFSRNGVVMAYTTNINGFSHVVLSDLMREKMLPPPVLPRGVLWSFALSTKGESLVVTFTSANHPADLYLVYPATGQVRRLTESSTAGIPVESFIEPKTASVPTRDGKRFPAFVYLPKDQPPGRKAPCVMMLHGGPEGQARPSFSYITQYFLNQGFAVVVPNVRGSSGYGKTFAHLDDKEKRLDSVADMADLVTFLEKEIPEIDSRRVALYGGSYGGYMVLAGLTEYPDLFAAGVCVVGIANFETFLEKTGAWRRKIREAEYGSLDNRELLRRISPIHKVDLIRAPLMVIHGKNDPRVPFHEAEQIVAALQKRDMPVELLAYDDEGHGLRKLTNKRDAYPKMAAFLKKHLLKKEEPTP